MEFDLAGAEWVIVAYVSGDKNMISVVESGKSPHIVTGSLISRVPEHLVSKEHEIVGSHTNPDRIAELRLQVPELLEGNFFLPSSMSIRQAGKKSNHGLNYDMRYRRFALENEIPEADAREIVEAYSGTAYPGLQDYWKYVRRCLKENDRTLVNLRGRKVRLLNEWGVNLFDAAYSFIPQSTVADLINDGLVGMYDNETTLARHAQLMAQIHDSVVSQFPEGMLKDKDILRMAEFASLFRNYTRTEMQFEDRKFSLSVGLKIGYRLGSTSSIGDCSSVEATANKIASILEKSPRAFALHSVA